MAEPHQTLPDDLLSLPLFPLNVVLFPGMALPLHIFEERYKAMIGDCIDREQPFGVVLIKQGGEAGEPAQPFSIGTTARVVRVERLAEGRMNILTNGERRFETTDISQRVPHLVGQVSYLEEHAGEVPSPVIAEISEEYSIFLQNLSALAGGWTGRAEVPEDPVRLSYSVATNLDLPRQVRQELLELPTADQRLERLLPLIKKGNQTLQEEVVKRNPFQGPRLN
jgi:Lon protease-like protein